jgi:hypothetical protein
LNPEPVNGYQYISQIAIHVLQESRDYGKRNIIDDKKVITKGGPK